MEPTLDKIKYLQSVNAELRDENAELRKALARCLGALQEALDSASVLAGWEAMYHMKSMSRRTPSDKRGFTQNEILAEKATVAAAKYGAILSVKDSTLNILEKGISNENNKWKNPVKRYKDESDYFINPHDALSLKFNNQFRKREPCE